MTRKARLAPVGAFKTRSHGDLMFVSYDSKRRPSDAVVRCPRTDYSGRDLGAELVEYQFEHGKKCGAMYREGGNILHRDGTIHSYGKPFWCAEGVVVQDSSGNCLRAPHGDPFEDALQTESAYCTVCDDWFPVDDSCRHIFWVDGVGDCGPGSDEFRGNPSVPEGFKRVVRFVGCARSFARALSRERGARIFTHAPLIGSASYDVSIGGREFGDRFGDLYKVRWSDGIVQEGCGWLRALDAKTKAANRLTLAWLREEIAAQDARRASGAAVYEVWAGPHYRPEQCTGKVSWAVAWQWACDLRAAGARGVRVVRRVPRLRADRRAA